MATILVQVLCDAKQFKAEMGSVAASTEGANSSLAKLGKATAIVGAALVGGVAFGLVKSVEAANKFQSSMELIQTQAGGSAKEVANMSKALLGMAASVGQTPETLSAGLYHIESAGYRGAKALAILKLAAEGAAVGHSDLEQTTNALVGAERTGIKGLGDMSQAMGTLNAIVGAGNMRMDDLTSALGTGVLVSAKAFGLSIQDVGGALATMTSNGIPAVNAASGLKMLFASLAAPTKNAAKQLASVGLSSDQLATTMRSKGLGPALVELKTHMMDAGLNATQMAALLTSAFGKKSSTGLLTLLGNLGDLKKATDQVTTGGKTFGANWAETQKTAQFASERFHAAIQALEIEVGSALLPTITRFTNWLTTELPVAIAAAQGAIKFLSPYFDQLKAAVEAAGGKFQELGGYMSDAVSVFMNLKGHSDAIKAALAVLAIGIGAVTIATLAMNAAMLLNPIALVIVAIAALAAGLVLAYENSKTFRDIVNAVFSALKTVAMDALGWITNTGLPDLEKAWKVVGPVVVGAVNGIIGAVKGIVSGIEQNWGTIKSIIVPPIEAAWNEVQLVFTTAKTTIINVVDGFKNLLEGHWGAAWGNLKTIVSTQLGFITGTISNLLQTMAATAGRLAETVGKAIADGIVSGVGDLESALQSKLTGALGGALGSVKSAFGINSPSKVFFDQVGVPMGQGIVGGAVQGMVDLAAKTQASIQAALAAATAQVKSAKSSFQNAWTNLTSSADTAFSKLQASVQTNSEKMIASMQAAASQTQLTNALTSAQASLASAQAGPQTTDAQKALAALQDAHDAAARDQALSTAQSGLATAQAGTDPAAIIAAQQQVADAQYAIQVASLQQQIAAQQAAADQSKAISDATTAVGTANQAISDAATLAGLQTQAAAERIQLDASNAARQSNFDTALAMLQKHLAAGHETYKQANQAILKLFKKFGVDYANAGAELGDAFVTSLSNAISGAASGAGGITKSTTLASAIGGNIPHAATGGFVAQTGLAVIHQGETITPASQVGQGGGNIYITGMIGDAQVEQLRNLLIRRGRNTTGGVLGGF